MADLLAAFADEFPDTKLSVPVVGQLLYEANKRSRNTQHFGVRFMENLFGAAGPRSCDSRAASTSAHTRRAALRRCV